jgi:hypothetical protein
MTTVNIVLKNEATGEMEKLHLHLKRLQSEVKKKTPIGADALKRLERYAYNMGREFGTALKEVGVSAGFVSGGFVAALASIASSLDKFASNAVEQHALAREVGLTYEQYERLVIAAKARGLTDEQARQQVERLARSLRDLSRGTVSAARQRLEGATRDESGADFARHFQQSLAQNGIHQAILELLERIRDKAGSGTDAGKWAAQIIRESMGADSPAWNGVRDILDKIRKVAIPGEEASRKYLLEQRKLGIQLTKLRNAVLAALLPAFTKLLELLQTLFTEENTKRLGQLIRDWWNALKEIDWENLRHQIDAVLSWTGEQIVAFVSDIANFIEELDKFFTAVDIWRGNTMWGSGKHKPIPFPNTGGLETIPMTPTPAPAPAAEPSSGGLGNLLGIGSIGGNQQQQQDNVEQNAPQRFSDDDSQDMTQRFSDVIDIHQADGRLTSETEKLSFQMRRFVDVLRDLRDGAGGGSSDGGVSRKARTRPMQTTAGGRGGATSANDNKDEPIETPVQRSQREDREAAGKSPVSPGMPPRGPRVVKATVFGNFPESLGSQIPGGWNDPDDKYKSGPLKGQPKPNYGGYAQSVPGVALPYKASAGRPEKMEGMPVRIWKPPGAIGAASILVRQIDIGPNQINPRSRDKGLDMNAALAEKLGTVQTKEQSRITGRPVFPSGQEMKYQVIRPEDMLRTRTEMEHERKRLEGRSIPWRRHGKLDLEVSVHAPKGVTVEASAAGNVEPGEVRINREFTRQAAA